MKSFNGIELEVGQSVVVAMPHGRNSGASLMNATVTKLLPKTIRVQGSGNNGLQRKDPDKIVVLLDDADKYGAGWEAGYSNGYSDGTCDA